MKDPAGKCLNPHCSKVAKHRGLCDACYSAASRLVREKRVTWAELEAQGKSLGRRGRSASGPIVDWLLKSL